MPIIYVIFSFAEEFSVARSEGGRSAALMRWHPEGSYGGRRTAAAFADGTAAAAASDGRCGQMGTPARRLNAAPVVRPPTEFDDSISLWDALGTRHEDSVEAASRRIMAALLIVRRTATPTHLPHPDHAAAFVVSVVLRRSLLRLDDVISYDVVVDPLKILRQIRRDFANGVRLELSARSLLDAVAPDSVLTSRRFIHHLKVS